MPRDGANPVEQGAANIIALSWTKEITQSLTLDLMAHGNTDVYFHAFNWVNAPRLKGVEEQIITKWSFITGRIYLQVINYQVLSCPQTKTNALF